jgi:predicted lipoprotein with Yx(FWY)xxD motif
MNKRVGIIIGVVVIVLIAVGVFAYLWMNKPGTTVTTTISTLPPVNNAVLRTKTSSSVGEYLTDPSGKALYTYVGDKTGVSNCTGTCLATWPPYVDSGAMTHLPTGVGMITRTDNGKMQYTYNGKPLYYFVGDVLGHVTGNGVSGFYVAKPNVMSGASTPTPAAATTSTSSSSW